MKNFITILTCLSVFALSAQDQFLQKDLNPGIDGSGPHDFVELNGYMFFIAYDGSSNRLWQCNGIRTGTIIFDTGYYNVQELTIIDNFLYFTAADATGNRRLYITDGIIGNPVNSISTNPSGSSNPSNIMKAANNRVYFFSDTSSNGRQLHSMTGNNASTLQVHLPTDPAYTTGFAYFQDIHYNLWNVYFGSKALVNAGTYVYYYAINPISNFPELWSMDYTAAVPTPNLVATGLNVSPKVPPHAFDNKVFVIESSELNYSDGVGYFTLLPGVIPNSLTNAGGRMYFSGLKTGTGFYWVLYDIDNLLNVTEHQNIRAEQPFGGPNPRGVLTLSNGKLYTYRNAAPNGLYEIDITNPAFPTATIAFGILPYDMEQIFPYGNLYFFAAANGGAFSLYRAYATGEEFITDPNVPGPDGYQTGLFFYFNALYFGDTVPSTQIVDCNVPSTYGRELYKLSDSQLGCNNGVFYNNAIFQDAIYASKQTFDVLPTSVAVANTCTILVSPSITLTGLTINGQFQTITAACK